MNSGFTLLEILLVVAILSLLMGIVIVAINPGYQLAQTRDAQRKNDVTEIRKAILQYYVDHKAYPAQTKDESLIYEICNTNFQKGSLSCTGFLDGSKVVPAYLTSIPIDPIMPKTRSSVGYSVAINSDTGVYVEAPNTEVGVGKEKQVIYDGKPPKGYSIPTITVPEEHNTFTQRIEQSAVTLVKNSVDWIKIVAIFSAGALLGGYLIQRRIAKKNKAGSSLLN